MNPRTGLFVDHLTGVDAIQPNYPITVRLYYGNTTNTSYENVGVYTQLPQVFSMLRPSLQACITDPSADAACSTVGAIPEDWVLNQQGGFLVSPIVGLIPGGPIPAGKLPIGKGYIEFKLQASAIGSYTLPYRITQSFTQDSPYDFSDKTDQATIQVGGGSAGSAGSGGGGSPGSAGSAGRSAASAGGGSAASAGGGSAGTTSQGSTGSSGNQSRASRASQAVNSAASRASIGAPRSNVSQARASSVRPSLSLGSAGSEETIALLAASNASRASDALQSICGNAILEIGEACDDGNRLNEDDCTDTCRRPQEFVCTSHQECASGLCIEGTCKLCASDAQCGGGACISGTCTDDVTLIALRPKALCANGLLEPQEECDDGNVSPGDGCASDCLLEKGRCGDGFVQQLLGEQCERSLPSPILCNDRCRFILQFCGNAQIDQGEECDEGPENSNHPTASCHMDCTRKRCGDGLLSENEACDDGNLATGDGCDRSCQIERQAPGTLPAQVVDLPLVPSELMPNLPVDTDGISRPLPDEGIGSVRPGGGHAPVGDTGPAAVAVMAAGAAAGWSWIRRRRR